MLALAAAQIRNPRDGAAGQTDFGDIDRDRNGGGHRGAVRIPAIGAPRGREFDAIEGSITAGVMRDRNPTRHVGGIVESCDQAVVVDVKHLNSAMRRDSFGKGHLEASVPFAVVFDGGEYFGRYSRQQEEKRRVEIISTWRSR